MVSRDAFESDVPVVPGLVLRPFRGKADYPGLVAVHDASREYDRVDPLSSLEHALTMSGIANSHLLGRDPECGLCIAEMPGAVVGYTSTTWWDETGKHSLYLHRGLVMPEWRGRGIGSTLLRWAEHRLLEVAAGRRGILRSSFAANATDTELDANALLRSEGYAVPEGRDGGYVELGLDDLSRLPEADLPRGITIRPVLPAHHRVIYEAKKESYSEEPDTPPSEEEFQRYSRQLSANPALCFVAWDGDTVVGQVLCAVTKGRGEITEVNVRKPWRRRGIGKALLVRALGELRARGQSQARLHTLRENSYGSIPLYESLGFRKLKNTYWYRKPMPSDLIAG